MFIPAASVLSSSWSHDKFKVAATAAFVGALLPDASLFAMFAIAKAQGVTAEVIFSEWYYSDYWQGLGAITNSIPVYAALTLVAWLLQRSITNISSNLKRWIQACLVIGLAALIHTLTDLPLHHDDGHPHFWPFSNWVFESPVSYWDPAHFGAQWTIIEFLVAGILIVFLWRRYANRLARVGLILAAISYAAMTLFWLSVF